MAKEQVRYLLGEAEKSLSRNPRDLKTSELILAVIKAAPILDEEGAGIFSYNPEKIASLKASVENYCREIDRRIPKNQTSF